MPTTNTCPYCHTPISVDLYEYAKNGAFAYRICPECDYSVLLPASESDTLAVERVVQRTPSVGVGLDG